MNTYALTGASFPMHIGDRELAACSLRDKDYIELDAYIQSKIIKIAKEQLDGLVPTERSELLQAAIKAAASSGWATPEGTKIINTVEGTLRLGWQMCRRKAPSLSFDSFLRLATKPDKDGVADEETTFNSIMEINKVYTVLHGNDEDIKEEKEEASPEDLKRNKEEDVPKSDTAL